jgi:hypothetical protein
VGEEGEGGGGGREEGIEEDGDGGADGDEEGCAQGAAAVLAAEGEEVHWGELGGGVLWGCHGGGVLRSARGNGKRDIRKEICNEDLWVVRGKNENVASTLRRPRS